ncbi:MAG TPA: phosphopentomutase [Capsulimonadaceae bacterium]
MARRVILIVMDGCGVGAMPDAAKYGNTDPLSATLQHVASAFGGLALPTLEAMGLGKVAALAGVSAKGPALGGFGRCAEQSAGKDSVTGHWEMMGIVTKIPFPTYPNGFPADFIVELEQAFGTKIIGNVASSGTEIIKNLGEDHVRTGRPIVYTSADSVLQIAAHESVIPLDKLYRMCEAARFLADPPNNVQRVIARPFVGDSAATFTRTENRRDFPALPPKVNILTALKTAAKRTHAIGVVADLFPRDYFTTAERTQANAQHLTAIEQAVAGDGFDFLFANCEDFDMLFGHRNDPRGFAESLAEFDRRLAGIVAELRPDDLLILTADHGNDPTTASTDHSREYAPVLVCGGGLSHNVDLGTRNSFADIGATVAKYLGAEWTGAGRSLLPD